MAASKQELAQQLAELLSFDELLKLLKEARARKPVDWTTVERTCPKCGRVGKVDPDFGVKMYRGEPHPQSWCKDCRAGTNYHARPRVNATQGPSKKRP